MRPIKFISNISFLEVSIHAPVKDATIGVAIRGSYFLVSIHAPVKDATKAYIDFRLPDLVSIHAPVKDATPEVAVPVVYRVFQSTHP